MSTKLRLATVSISFGPNYSQPEMARLMEHINELTRLNQKFIQMLLGGDAGQVLTKIDEKDLHAEWGEGSGGSSIIVESGKLVGRFSAGDGPPQNITIGANLLLTGDVLSAVVPAPPTPTSGDGYPVVLGHAGI